MRAALVLFSRRLDELESETRLQGAVNDLRKLAQSGPLTDALIGEETRRDLLAPSSIARRRLQYGNTMTTLYAIWESYVEALLEAYIEEQLSNTVAAPTVVKNHLSKALEVIQLANKGVARYADVKTVELLRTAAAVQEGDLGSVSSLSLIHHSFNLRSSGVQSITSDLGASDVWHNVLKDERLISTLTRNGLPLPSLDSSNRELFFLDDLCQRRNEYAHGQEVDDFLDETFQLAYISGLRALAIALYAALVEKSYFVGSSRYTLLGTYVERYNKKIVVAIVEARASCEVDDHCLIVQANGTRSLRAIGSLQIDDQSCQSASALVGGTELGIGFDAGVPKAGTIFVRSRA